MSKRPHTHASKTLQIWLAFAALLLQGLAGTAWALNDYPRNDLWITDGRIEAVARSADTIYLGGTFNTVAPFTGSALLMDATSGAPVLPLAKIKGIAVHAAVPDGAGGWYLGGRFEYVDDVATAPLVHILPDGRLDPDFSFSFGIGQLGTTIVRGLELSPSGVLYVVGEFGSIDGQARSNAAAIDTTTATLTSWAPALTSFQVNAVLLSGNTVFLGGGDLIAADATTAAVQTLDSGLTIEAIVLNDAGTTLYYGGSSLKAYDLTTQQVLLSWNPAPNGRVLAMQISGSTVYVGGDFTTIGGQSRPNLAAVNANTGTASGWNPSPNGRIGALLLRGNTLYAGGAFTLMGAAERRGYAEVNILDASVGANNPRLNAPIQFSTVVPTVDTIAYDDGRLMLGGGFNGSGAVSRRNIAALNANTGAATDWTPDADNTVDGLLLDGNTLYARGLFSSIGGQTRSRLAALDVTLNTNNATAFVADLNASARDMARAGTTLYVVGFFTSASGEPRSYIAAFDAVTGSLSTWNPGADRPVYAIDIVDDFIYLGGDFTQINNQFRNKLALLRGSTGAVLPFDPNVGPSAAIVTELLVSDGKVYASGQFTNVGGQPRGSIAVVDAFTGQATDPVISIVPAINPSIAKRGNILYMAAGTGLGTVQGVALSNVAALDVTTGSVTDWRPAQTAAMRRIFANGDYLDVVGPTLAMGAPRINPAHMGEYPLAADENGINVDFLTPYNALAASLAPGLRDGDIDNNGRQDLDEFACLADLLSDGDASVVPQIASTFELNRDQMKVDLGSSFLAQQAGADALLGAWLMFGNQNWIGDYATTCSNCPGTYSPNGYHFAVNPDVELAFSLCTIGTSNLIFGNGFE
ncbi:MAG: hypothetical protein AB7E72_04065 [Lysobacterales bacterium]